MGAAGRPRTIAIDGPVASGKSSAGQGLAARLGYLVLDTGLLYRAAARLAIDADVPLEDGARVAALVKAAGIEVRQSAAAGDGPIVLAGGCDVAPRLGTSEVDAGASIVSAQPEVRGALLDLQRRTARRGAVVMVGRDIGTVVLPDADLKIYLDASAEARARRRWAQRREQGLEVDFASILEAVIARDARDAGRSLAPLAAAADAVVVDTEWCDLEAVIDHLAELVDRWPDDLTTRGGRAPCDRRPEEEGP